VLFPVTTIMRKTILALLLLASTSLFAHNGHVHNVLGTVKTIQPTQLVVQKTDGTDLTVVLNGATKYEMGGNPASSADLVSGSRVSVHLADDSKTAVMVKIAAPKKD
jgi:hypothetical protein